MLFRSLVVFTLVFTLSGTPANATGCKTDEKCVESVLYSLHPAQLYLLKLAYFAGVEYNLSESLISIVMQETLVGKYNLNADEHSGGLTGVSADQTTDMVQYRMRNPNMSRSSQAYRFKRNLILLRLVRNHDYAFEQAIIILNNFRKRFPAWSAYVSAYNSGNNYDDPLGREYFREILNIKRVLIKNKTYIMLSPCVNSVKYSVSCI